MKKGEKFINEKNIIIEIISEKDELGQVLCRIGSTYCCTSEESLNNLFKMNNYRKIK